jgi:hypothetical protein
MSGARRVVRVGISSSLLFGSSTGMAVVVLRFSLVALRRHLSVVLPVVGGAKLPGSGLQQAVAMTYSETIEVASWSHRLSPSNPAVYYATDP